MKTKKFFSVIAGLVIISSFIGVSKAEAATKPFDYELIYQSPYPSTLAPGATTNVWVEVKNIGTVTWHGTGIENVVRLGAGSKYGTANQQRDYNSEFYDDSVAVPLCVSSVNISCIGGGDPIPSWLSSNRPTAVIHSEVRPGWHTRFQFTIKAPTTPGTYKAYFTPVVEGVEWMKDIGIYWEITVSGSSCGDGGVSCMANPASVKCIDDGGTLNIVTNTDGSQSGICTLPSNRVCEEWDYFANGSSCTNRASGGQNATLTSLTLSPNGAVFVKSGNVYDFVLIANYSDGSTQTVTNSAAWDVIFNTGTGTMHTVIPGRFIAGGMGTCTVTASFQGKNATSGIVTVTGL